MLYVPHKERLSSFKCLELICHRFFLGFCSHKLIIFLADGTGVPLGTKLETCRSCRGSNGETLFVHKWLDILNSVAIRSWFFLFSMCAQVFMQQGPFWLQITYSLCCRNWSKELLWSQFCLDQIFQMRKQCISIELMCDIDMVWLKVYITFVIDKFRLIGYKFVLGFRCMCFLSDSSIEYEFCFRIWMCFECEFVLGILFWCMFH